VGHDAEIYLLVLLQMIMDKIVTLEERECVMFMSIGQGSIY